VPKLGYGHSLLAKLLLVLSELCPIEAEGPKERPKKKGPHHKFEVPQGYVAKGFGFEVEWPEQEDRACLVRSHFGARRFAYNWPLGQVKSDMDARKLDPSHKSLPWDLYSLRKEWNRVKDQVAPWWAGNSKECYSSGIAELCTALKNWKASKARIRKGKKVGFPRFKSKMKDQGRVRFSTGAMRAEADRRTVTLPVIGPLRSKESTRRLERLVRVGRAEVLNATLSVRWGRLFVSFACIVQKHDHAPAPKKRAAVDLGLRSLATVADTDGNILEVPNPAPLRKTLAERRKLGRRLSRRIPASHGHREAKAKLAKLDRRCVNLRKQASHQLTTMLARNYQEVVIEDLDIAALKRSMGRRAFRRSVSDAALGAIRPQLTYKLRWQEAKLTVADRWYPSSKLHHGCGCRLIEPHKLAKQLVCAITEELVDRDINAALNLRDWPEDKLASYSSVGAVAPLACNSDDGQDARSPGAVGGHVRPLLTAKAVPGEARTRKGTPVRGEA
jgi:putative transposase